MSLRTALIWLLASLLVCSVLANKSRKSEKIRPNLLLLFPDQWRFDWGGSLWKVPLKTPNFDSVVARGTAFKRAYVASPLCAPSRGCLAAGKEYDHAGVPSNFANDFPPNQTTFYQLLRDDAGYHVMTCGKDDLTKKSSPGLNGSYRAVELGFSDWLRNAGKRDVVNSPEPHEPYGVFLQSQNVTVEGQTENLWAVHKNEWGKNGDCQWKGVVCNKSSPLPDFAYEDNWIAKNGLTLLSRKPSDKPWFLQVNIAGPHPPFSITNNMSETVRNREFPLAVDHSTLTEAQQQIVRQDYAAEIENIDHWIGRYIQWLSDAGELNRTVVCISSDHGEMLGDHNDWGKSQPWQGSNSVPLVCMGETFGIEVGETIDQPVSTMDLAATFLDYAGAKPAKGMTSTSLREMLQGKAEKNRDFVSSGLGKWRAVIQKVDDQTVYKLICCNGTCPGQPKNATTTPKGAFYYDLSHQGDCYSFPPSLLPKYCQTPKEERNESADKKNDKKPTVLLYNVAADPFEMTNLASSKGDIVKKMLPLLPANTCPAIDWL